MKKSIALTATVSAISLSAATHAAILADYQFGSGAPSASTVGANVTANDFVAVAGDVGTSIPTTIGFSSGGQIFIRSQVTGADAAAALADGDYFSVTLSAASGYELDLTSLTLRLGSTRDNTTSFTNNAVLQSSVGGFGTGNPSIAGTNTSFTANTAATTYQATDASFDLTGAGFQNLSTITFQVRLFDNLNENGKLTRIDFVTLNGDAVLVPEPATLGLLAMGAAGLVRRRRLAQ